MTDAVVVQGWAVLAGDGLAPVIRWSGGPARAGTKTAGGRARGHGVAARTEAAEVRTERDASRWSERSAHQISDTRKFGAVMGEEDRDAW